MKLHCILFFVFINVALLGQQRVDQIPHLEVRAGSTQLIVGGKPYLILGGELGNSSASSTGYMKPIWPKLVEMNLNTVLLPVYWDLTEPEEGRFNFQLLDSMITGARKHNLKLVLLWFGTWKNSMSCYAPDWVKKDARRFPRAKSKAGENQEILTPFSESNLKADVSAFSALMKHVSMTDRGEQTVIMVQVENEIGMLPDARDYSQAANEAFSKNVPSTLVSFLKKNKDSLSPGVKHAWETNGFRETGTWSEIFGPGLATDEIFIAWHFAQFANKVTEAGKKIYSIPMFVNAALNRPNVKPGDYPSGGPLPHVIDVWKAGAPLIDFLSPDFYNPDFKYWNDLYARKDNPLFIPEIRSEPSIPAKVFYAVGHYRAIGFAPFSIESTDNPKDEPLTRSYQILSQLSPLITASEDQRMDGIFLSKHRLSDTLKFGDYEFIVRHDYTLGWSPKAKEEAWPEVGGLIIQTGEDEFMVAGTGIVVTFFVNGLSAGILNIDEGSFINTKWTPQRRMNGDQSHQGRHLRFAVGESGIQKVRLYKYK